jgi:hypothetical protein
MSALLPKADISRRDDNVRFGPKADMGIDIDSGPLGAISGFATITHNARALQHV